MKGASKVIMGATLVMVVSLAVVLALVLVLLVDLYCTLLHRRRQLRLTSSSSNSSATNTTTSTTGNISPPRPQQPPNQPAPHSLPTYHAHGVLQAPRSFLFPAVSRQENEAAETKNQHQKLHQFLEAIHTQDSNTSPHQIGLMKIPSPSVPLATSPHQIQENPIPVQITPSNAPSERASAGGGQHFLYISNPMYDNDASRPSKGDTPFETPDSSPSRLEHGGSSSEEEITPQSPSSPHSLAVTPPLTPMKKLPAEACSVSLRDARSLGTSGSDSVSNNHLSSSSSDTQCTSPSW